MKVLQISTSDYLRWRWRNLYLTVGLKNSGIECKILSAIKTLGLLNQKSLAHPDQRFGLRKSHQKLGLNNIHCVGSFKVSQNEFYLDADIINFHVIHSGFFSYLAIPH